MKIGNKTFRFGIQYGYNQTRTYLHLSSAIRAARRLLPDPEGCVEISRQEHRNGAWIDDDYWSLYINNDGAKKEFNFAR